jgi:uncharacterized lipoprotein YddW (UPF0748 family)
MNKKSVLAPNHICARYPSVCFDYGDNQWMDPGAEVVQNNTYDVIMDIINRYDVDGIHFDGNFILFVPSSCYHWITIDLIVVLFS